MSTTTTKHVPPPSSTSSRSYQDDREALSNQKNVNFFDKLKTNVKEMGHEFTHIAHTGQRAISQAAKTATSQKNAQRARNDISAELRGEDWGRSTATEIPRPTDPKKPPFQRPVNPNSTLIANGWLEQQRRSKMRVVWKEVLVSLVAGRKPGEETTLWVQRETTNPITGTVGLEALHQIPIKGMQDVNYVDFSTDHRFTIQVYNLSDEFVFRTRDNGDAAKNWVSTLRLTREAILNGIPPPKPGDLAGASRRTKTYPGTEDEKKADSPLQQPQQHQHQQHHQPPPPQQHHHQQPPPPPQQQHQPPQQPPQEQHQAAPPPEEKKKMSVREMRAICHAAGINTAGFERGQLEAAVARVQQHQAGRATPSGPSPPPTQPSSSLDDSERAQQIRRDEEAAARAAAEERQRAEAERRRAAEAEEMRRRQQHAEYLRQQEIHRQQQAQAAAQQKWHEDQRRAEEQRRYQQQQAQWQQQQAQQQAQWQQQQRQAQQNAHWQQQQQHPHPQHPQHPQQQGWNPHQQHPHPQQPPPGHPQNGQPPPPGPQPNGQQPHGHPASQADQKWAKQANDGDDSQSSTVAIKHHILIQWALQPPNMQMLRPIEGLLTTVHTVFPPILGVAGHDYFQKWNAVSMESLCDESGRPEEKKLAKAVKKLRFFLHPDKLIPLNLNEDQTFVCKMLWDVTSDAWEEYEKQKEQLNWLNQ